VTTFALFIVRVFEVIVLCIKRLPRNETIMVTDCVCATKLYMVIWQPDQGCRSGDRKEFYIKD